MSLESLLDSIQEIVSTQELVQEVDPAMNTCDLVLLFLGCRRRMCANDKARPKSKSILAFRTSHRPGVTWDHGPDILAICGAAGHAGLGHPAVRTQIDACTATIRFMTSWRGRIAGVDAWAGLRIDGPYATLRIPSASL